ncbi:U32 family peptidase [Parachitinimonas caeni]|uniref:Ubiquinone biosynthesis protein UbiV n=1 Tax=Parachitinimonas caeni TaxID=3031301 RepID=A0ABT7E2X4_9NEIS|nr:U32 family peptidase [Parachitinimonas caeni]MDK2126671.1 U32 family peptidase [Parachitinimonas caeni]
MNRFEISLAPLAYYWSKSATLEFYAEASQWPVDIIYLGEVVCGRRHNLRLEDWLGLAADLHATGKQVVLSTQTLIDSESDRRGMRRLIERALASGFLVEANDLSAVRALSGQKFVAGPHLNVYHAATHDWLAGLGACRFIPPVELAADDLAALLKTRSRSIQTELQVWGRMALAFSARCFTARHHRLRKDDCEFRCEAHAEGLLLSSREGQPFLNLNGIQTQSAGCLDLGRQLPQLAELGVTILRLQPQSQGMVQIVSIFDEARRSGAPAAVPSHLFPPGASRSNGYWFGEAGMRWQGECP